MNQNRVVATSRCSPPSLSSPAVPVPGPFPTAAAPVASGTLRGGARRRYIRRPRLSSLSPRQRRILQQRPHRPAGLARVLAVTPLLPRSLIGRPHAPRPWRRRGQLRHAPRRRAAARSQVGHTPGVPRADWLPREKWSSWVGDGPAAKRVSVDGRWPAVVTEVAGGKICDEAG